MYKTAALVVTPAILATGISSIKVTYAQTNTENHAVIGGYGPALLGTIGHPWFSVALQMWCGFSSGGSGDDNGSANGP